MLRRVVITVGAVSVLLVVGGGTALAKDPWGGVDCNQTAYTGCQLGAGQGSGPAQSQPGRNGSGGQHDGSGSNSNRPAASGDQLLSEPKNLANCSYVRSDYQPPGGGTVNVAYHPPSLAGDTVNVMSVAYHSAATPVTAQFAAQPPGRPGAWYVYQCSGPGFADGMYRAPIWIADGQAPGAPPLPSPQEMAQRAYNQLRLPSPRIRKNPVNSQLVRLPTWMWLDSDGWGPKSATAAVPGVSVTATATPDSVTWQMGDGSSVTCHGQGTAFPAGANPIDASPDCGHTYMRSSQGQPNNAFPVATTVHWTVTWSGVGQSGTFPDLAITSNASFVVAESQALNRN